MNVRAGRHILVLIGHSNSSEALIMADDSTVNGLVGRWVGEYADQAARVPNRFAHPQCYRSDGVSCPAARSLFIRQCTLLATLICHYSVSLAVRRVAYFTSTRRPNVKVDLSCSAAVAWAAQPLCGANKLYAYSRLKHTDHSSRP
jgi:hypothetical protein